MSIFAIRDDVVVPGKDIAYLHYNQETKTFRITIPSTTTALEAPPIISHYIERGLSEIDPYFSYLWVKQRVAPPERQNIAEMLANIGATEYDEYLLLMATEGRCVQDQCYLVPVDAAVR